MRGTILTTLCLLLALFEGTNGQVCDTTVRLTDPITLNASSTTCIQCFLQGQVQTVVQWVADGNLISGSENGVSLDNGVLVISNATAFVNAYGGAPVEVSCSSGLMAEEDVYLAGFFPPEMSVTNTGIVTEGGSITLSCSNTNTPGTVLQELLNPQGEVISIFALYTLNNVLRNQTGVYQCRLTNINDNRTLFDTENITVHYSPDVTSNDPPSQLVSLIANISLSCTYDSLPASIVTWFHNNTQFTNSTDDVIINVDYNTSTLTVTSLTRDSGGNYTCTATNVVGNDSSTVSVTIQIPPAAATNLTISNEQETTLDISWMNNFNGFSPITGVFVTINSTDTGIALRSMMIPGGSTLTNATLPALLPLTNYTIELRVVNAVGHSDPAYTAGTTLSLFLTAPVMVILTSPSSTSLLLDWEKSTFSSVEGGLESMLSSHTLKRDMGPLLQPPTPVPSTSPPTMWTVQLLDSDLNINLTECIQDPGTTQFTFHGLDKGTTYSTRVAGSNVRGLGEYSVTVTNQTLVDPPSVPQRVDGDAVGAFSFQVSWASPADSGGGAVSAYVVAYRVAGGSDMLSELTVNDAMFELLVRNGGDPSPPKLLVNSTTYEIQVWAVNQAGRGPAVSINITTQSLDEPQQIFVPPTIESELNTSAVVSWPRPLGVVETFLVQYKLRIADWTDSTVVNVTVPGNVTTVTLTDLYPEAQYDVRVRTNNALGSSQFSALQTFVTLPPSPPTVSGPATALVGTDRVQINCSSVVDSIAIIWFQLTNNELTSISGSSMQIGDNLIFTNPLLTDSGVYVCRLGSASTQHTISFQVLSPPTVSGPTTALTGADRIQINCSSSVDIVDIVWSKLNASDELTPLPESAEQEGDNLIFRNPTLLDSGTYVCRLGSVSTQHTITFQGPGGISTTVIIIASVVGGVALLVILGVVVVLLVVFCVCCCGSAKKSSGYAFKSKAKKSMAWIETSSTNPTPSYTKQPDNPAAYDLPEDLVAHSSFNTVEKQNIAQQSPPPNEAPPSYDTSGV